MSDYKPQGTFNVWFQLLKRTITHTGGVNVEHYVEDLKAKCSLITYSTNDTTTAQLKNTTSSWNFETYFTKAITTGDRIKILATGEVFDIVGKPENVRMENKYLKCKLVEANG